MELKLTRPICFFDLETTGTNISKDRIVEISILKVYENNNKESFTWKVNPGVPIPKETTAIHGISDEDVADEPKFEELAPKINAMIKGCDLAGYNSNSFAGRRDASCRSRFRYEKSECCGCANHLS
jgi:DNA polymerase-3 subunit epsilon